MKQGREGARTGCICCIVGTDIISGRGAGSVQPMGNTCWIPNMAACSLPSIWVKHVQINTQPLHTTVHYACQCGDPAREGAEDMHSAAL